MKRGKLDHLPLNKEILAAAYDYLRSTPPFSDWHLPDSEDVDFIVIKHPEDWGRYTCSGRGKSKKHFVSISSTKVAHTHTLIYTIAHEMLHMHQEITGQCTNGVMHNRAFKLDGHRICCVHGFDPKAF